MAPPARDAEVHHANRGRDVIRKKIPRNTDSTLLENRHLADVPFNRNNKLITRDDVLRIFASLGLEIGVHDVRLYQLACVHRSYLRETLQLADRPGGTGDLTAEGELDAAVPALLAEGYLASPQDAAGIVPLQEHSSERLEFLGDAVCGLSVASYLYSRYPDQDEGFMTKLRTRIVCGSKLGELAERIGLPEYVVMSRYVEHCNRGRNNHKVLEDVFESFVGAVFLDNDKDYGVCDAFMTRILETYIDFSDTIRNNDNYKDILLQFYQANFDGAFPKYVELLVEVVNNVKVYTMGILSPDGDQVLAVGKNSRKRQAEQESSRRALVALGAPGFVEAAPLQAGTLD